MPEPIAPLPPNVIDEAVLTALEEDGAGTDVTTRALISPEQWGRGVFIAKDDGIICGLAIAAAAMTALSEEVSFDASVEDGSRVSAGAELAEVEGPLTAILGAERVALNFVQRLSGIATLTAEYVNAVSTTRARILDTRKTTPGLRAFERYAVRCGGGQNHRFNLADGVLIKDNHIAGARAAGIDDVGDVVRAARNGAPHTLRIEVEVTDLEQLKQALEGGADIILLDNMTPSEMRDAVSIVGGRAIVEASGGVTLDNVREIAATGVDFISVGRLTHSAASLDISLEVGAA